MSGYAAQANRAIAPKKPHKAAAQEYYSKKRKPDLSSRKIKNFCGTGTRQVTFLGIKAEHPQKEAFQLGMEKPFLKPIFPQKAAAAY